MLEVCMWVVHSLEYFQLFSRDKWAVSVSWVHQEAFFCIVTEEIKTSIDHWTIMCMCTSQVYIHGHLKLWRLYLV